VVTISYVPNFEWLLFLTVLIFSDYYFLLILFYVATILCGPNFEWLLLNVVLSLVVTI